MPVGESDATIDHAARVRGAWLGRISGCMLGKPVETLSMMSGRVALDAYLADAGVTELRDYVPYLADSGVAGLLPNACLGGITCAIPDDDINYTVLALMLLEERGFDFTTDDVGRAWLRYLPGGMTFTAEREAYARMLADVGMGFTFGAPPEFDLAECSDNPFNDWIGAQIRADLYGWVAPGQPELAAELARRDAALSHRDEGVYGAQFVAAAGAGLAGGASNGATVGALWGLTGRPIPTHWTEPWDGRVQVTLAGVGELDVDDLVHRTLAVRPA